MELLSSLCVALLQEKKRHKMSREGKRDDDEMREEEQVLNTVIRMGLVMSLCCSAHRNRLNIITAETQISESIQQCCFITYIDCISRIVFKFPYHLNINTHIHIFIFQLKHDASAIPKVKNDSVDRRQVMSHRVRERQ